jgi:Lipocalin-like domain
MKKIKIIILLSLITLSSCSKDNNAATLANFSIIGKWNFTSTALTSNGFVGPEEDNSGFSVGCNKNFLQFNSTGIANYKEYDLNCQEKNRDLAWSQVGDVLNIDFNDNMLPKSFKIISLSATEFKFKGDMTGMEGVAPGVNLFITFTFAKAQ